MAENKKKKKIKKRIWDIFILKHFCDILVDETLWRKHYTYLPQNSVSI